MAFFLAASPSRKLSPMKKEGKKEQEECKKVARKDKEHGKR